jgi:replicative DNA helicase
MHEEIESWKTKYYAAQVAEKSVLNDLYDFREKILNLYLEYEKQKEKELNKMKAKPKTYDGPARALIDPESSKRIRSVE